MSLSKFRQIRNAVVLAAAVLPLLASASEFPANVSSRDVPRLMRATEYVRELDEKALVRLVPVQSGLRYVDCPNCSGGRQENQLEWNTQDPEGVTCRFCRHRFPSDQFPMNEAVTVHSPAGEIVRFPYWADKNGYRHFFQARRDDEVRHYLADRTRDLALLYAATGDRSHARRAALLTDRFAQVFPGWCYHFDYPFQQKEIYDGDVLPAKFRPGFRTARWNWWAYNDIPLPLVEAYDRIRESGVFDELSRELGVDTAARVERDLFRNAAEQVLANPDPLTNMSPSAWRSLIYLGRVISEPRYVHASVRRLRMLAETRFFYDGAWPEGSPDYAAQTIGGLSQVISLLKGYSDPAGYRDSEDGSRFDQLNVESDFPALQQAREALMKMRFPDGRAVPVHDTWSTSRRGATDSTAPWLLPALGHACLGGGDGRRQTQFHLTWSGGYGHSHADNLSLLMYSSGREMLSDLGYTHTALRAWTLASVAHNTVVIDGHSQSLGREQNPSDGRLLFCDFTDPTIQLVRADGTRGYEKVARTFERTLIVIDAGKGRRFAVDRFKVDGGNIHDYLLHGDADNPAKVTSTLEMESLHSLLPENFKWQPARNEGEAGRALERYYGYGYLQNLKTTPVEAGSLVPVEFAGVGTAAPGVRVSLFPESGCQLITGENPSIRQAGEDDAKLDQFRRPFMMLRRLASETPSTFVSVLEPFEESGYLDSVEQIADGDRLVGLRIKSDDQTDFLVFDAQQPVTIVAGGQEARFEGDIGFMRLRGDGVEHACVLGKGGWERGSFRLTSSGSQESVLKAIQGRQLVCDDRQQTLPKRGDVVRVITADGWVYGYTVDDARVADGELRITVVEGPGMTFDHAAKRLQLTSFPQRSHTGTMKVEWVSAVHSRKENQ